MPRSPTTCAILLATLLAAAAARAADPAAVAQTGPAADAAREALAQVTLPEGFRIGLYAIAPGARSLAVAPEGGVVFIGTRGTDVWAAADGDGDGVADTVSAFAPALAKHAPNGPCFGPDGTLYLAEVNRITAFPAAAATWRDPDPPATPVVPEGALVPPEGATGSHRARVCRIGPDGLLYVAIGQPYNVPPPGKLALFDRTGIGGIVRMKTDGSGREVYSRGIRNSVGLDFDPATGDLWFTDNQVDGMGDDIPPGEINHQTAPGQTFGFPWYGGGDVRTGQYRDSDPPADAVFPAVETVAHAADLGMTFYRGSMFPPAYHGAIFSAQHGSWNRTEPVGARVMVTTFGADGTPTSRPFAEGWLRPDGHYAGRPVDVAELPDGSLLVSDDEAGAVYRIWYRAPD